MSQEPQRVADTTRSKGLYYMEFQTGNFAVCPQFTACFCILAVQNPKIITFNIINSKNDQELFQVHSLKFSQ